MSPTTASLNTERTVHDAASAHISEKKHGSDLESLDDATSSFADLKLDPVAIRKLRRKIDLNVMPLVCALYMFAFMGRHNIGKDRCGLHDVCLVHEKGARTQERPILWRHHFGHLWPHAIEQLNGAPGLHDWQWIFLI